MLPGDSRYYISFMYADSKKLSGEASEEVMVDVDGQLDEKHQSRAKMRLRRSTTGCPSVIPLYKAVRQFGLILNLDFLANGNFGEGSSDG